MGLLGFSFSTEPVFFSDFLIFGIFLGFGMGFFWVLI
jgi:hypothetical protein